MLTTANVMATANVHTRKVVIKSLEIVMYFRKIQINLTYGTQSFQSLVTPFLYSFPSSTIWHVIKLVINVSVFAKPMMTPALVQKKMPCIQHPEFEKYGTKIRTCEKFDACTSVSVKRIMDSFVKPD